MGDGGRADLKREGASRGGKSDVRGNTFILLEGLE